MKASTRAIAILLLLPIRISAEETAAFLKIGVGARALGMGGAYTAVADDVNAIAWNPAGLAGLPARELGVMHAEMVGLTRYDFLGYAHPFEGRTFAASVRHLSNGGLEGRDTAGKPTGGYSASDTAVDLAYAFRLSESVRLGGGLKYIRSSIAEKSAQSYALDLGGMCKLPRLGPGSPELGFSVQHLGPAMRFLDESNPLPLTLATGLAYRLPKGLLLSTDYRYRPYSKYSEVSIGAEYAILSSFALRAGYGSAGTLSSQSGPSGLDGLAGGFGVRLYGYKLDYSISPFSEAGHVHRFSLGASF